LLTRFAQHTVLNAVSGSCLMLASLFSGIVIARLLGTEGTGTVVFSLWIASVITPLIGGGVSASIARTLPELRGRGEERQAQAFSGWLSRRLLAYLLLAFVGFAAAISIQTGMAARIGAFLSQEGSETQGSALLFLLPVLIAAQVMALFGTNYLRGRQDFSRLARLSVWSLLLQVILVGIGAAYYGVPGAIAGYLIGQLPLASIVWTLLPRAGEVEAAVLQRSFRYARFAWAANIANTFVWSRLEIFFLDRYWGHAEIAFFSIALALSSLASQGPLLLTGAFLPLFAEQRGRGDEAAMKAIYVTGTRLTGMLAIPACLGMAAIAPAIVPLFYGAEFAAAVPATAVIVAAASISVTTVIGTHLVNATERSDIIFYTAIFGAALAVVGGLLLVPQFGLMGAAVSRAIIQIVMVGLGMWFVTSKLEFPFPARSILWIYVCSGCSSMVAWSIVATLDPPLSILAAIVAASFVYLGCLRLCRAADPDDLQTLSEIVDSFPKPLSLFGGPVLWFLGHPMKATERHHVP
jgi:O-antigen/teichoic acid export membrane protein